MRTAATVSIGHQSDRRCADEFGAAPTTRLTERQLTQRVAVAACIVSCLLVALNLWDNRDLFDPEGISYLDVADAYLRGDWHAALVGNWSPLYSWLLALMMLLFDPSPKWEFTAVHALNYCIYLGTLVSFGVFLREFMRSGTGRVTDVRLPDWTWLALGYALFTWSVVRLIPAHQPQPDLFVCAMIYLIIAALLRIRRGVFSWRDSIVFGTLLALGYFGKGLMYPMAFVFTIVAVVLARRHAVHGQAKMLAAFSIFLLLSTPYVAALSNAHGRLMFNDAGRLNYAWEINQVKKWNHWQGEDGAHGTPLHPTRKILDDPPMYEFATPFQATYPPWYDPSYWYEGVQPSVDLRRQLVVLIRNARVLVSFLVNAPGPIVERHVSWGGLGGDVESTIGPLFTLWCVIAAITRPRIPVLRRTAEYWFILVPVMAALGAYAFLHFEGRYIAAYVVVLWMLLFRLVAVQQSGESRRLFTAALACAALLITMTLSVGAVRAVLHVGRHLMDRSHEIPAFRSGYSNWKVVEYLNNAGVHAGDRVGAVGWSYSAYWARMGRLRIVAEVPSEGADAFWKSNSKRADAMQLFQEVGAKAVVAKGGYLNAQLRREWDLRGLPGEPAPLPLDPSMPNVPIGTAPANWHYIPDTDFYVYVFANAR